MVEKKLRILVVVYYIGIIAVSRANKFERNEENNKF